MIVDQAIYRQGQRLPCGDLSDALDELRGGDDPHAFLWIGLKNPTDAEFDLVNDELKLHPLAVEDAVKGNQRPKVELYDNTIFVVMKTLRYIEETSDVETGEVMLFVGDRFVVTVRRGEANPLAGVRQSARGQPDTLRHGEIAVVHAVMDSIVDNYVAIDAELQKDLEDIEASVFAGANRVSSATIYQLKREVLEFRRAAVPLAAPLRMLHDGSRSPLPAQGGAAALPRRRRPPAARDRPRRVLRPAAHRHPQRPPRADHRAAEQRHAEDLRLGRDRRRAHDDRRRLRHELRQHARAAVAVRLLHRRWPSWPTACLGLYRAFRKSGWL